MLYYVGPARRYTFRPDRIIMARREAERKGGPERVAPPSGDLTGGVDGHAVVTDRRVAFVSQAGRRWYYPLSEVVEVSPFKTGVALRVRSGGLFLAPDDGPEVLRTVLVRALAGPSLGAPSEASAPPRPRVAVPTELKLTLEPGEAAHLVARIRCREFRPSRSWRRAAAGEEAPGATASIRATRRGTVMLDLGEKWLVVTDRRLIFKVPRFWPQSVPYDTIASLTRFADGLVLTSEGRPGKAGLCWLLDGIPDPGLLHELVEEARRASRVRT